MEKLIELLNEYNKIHNYAPIEYYDDEADGFETNYVAFYKTCVIISKQFGFIKWLVDNDKIDVESYCRITSVERKGEKDVYRDEVDSLLMLLAISDSPLEFLCSILK